MGLFLQCICILNHHSAYFKYLTILIFNYTSIRLKKIHMQFSFVIHYISLDLHFGRQLILGGGIQEGEQSVMYKGSNEKVSQKPR